MSMWINKRMVGWMTFDLTIKKIEKLTIIA